MSDILKNRLLQKEACINDFSNKRPDSEKDFINNETVPLQNIDFTKVESSTTQQETEINGDAAILESREKIGDPLDICVAQIDPSHQTSSEIVTRAKRKKNDTKIKDQSEIQNHIVKKLKKANSKMKIRKTKNVAPGRDKPKTHQEFICEECGRKFFNKGSFHTHVKSHSSEKHSRNASTEAPQKLTCDHEKNNFKKFECYSLKYEDIKKFHNSFYQNKSKILQDAMILKYVNVYPPSRVLSKNSSTTKRNYSANFFVPGENDKLYSVCKSAFLDILSITRTRVNGVIARFFSTGKMPVERRGGDRKSSPNKNRLRSVQDFIKTFDTYETECCRCNEKKIFLDENLSVIKMWQLYQKSVEAKPDLQVKDSWFRMVFNKYFDINVGSPKKIPCASCVEAAKNNQNKVHEIEPLVKLAER